MKNETKWFLDKRILELSNAVSQYNDIPKNKQSSWDMERLKSFRTELCAYQIILRIEFEGQIPHGYERK